MREPGTAHAKDIQERTLNVMVQIFNGDMIAALSAYGAIYPHLWKTCLNDDEMKCFEKDIEKGIQEYK